MIHAVAGIHRRTWEPGRLAAIYPPCPRPLWSTSALIRCRGRRIVVVRVPGEPPARPITPSALQGERHESRSTISGFGWFGGCLFHAAYSPMLGTTNASGRDCSSDTLTGLSLRRPRFRTERCHALKARRSSLGSQMPAGNLQGEAHSRSGSAGGAT